MNVIKAVLTDGKEIFNERTFGSLYELGLFSQGAQAASDGNVYWKAVKSPVKYVALNRAEGPCEECTAVVYYVGEKPEVIDLLDKRYYRGAEYVQVKDIYNDVLHRFICWGMSAPKSGYDKVDFLVQWENGKIYEGRFDMQEGGTDGDESFWVSLKGRLEFYSLRKGKPERFTLRNWASFCEQAKEDGSVVECGEILDSCALSA